MKPANGIDQCLEIEQSKHLGEGRRLKGDEGEGQEDHGGEEKEKAQDDEGEGGQEEGVMQTQFNLDPLCNHESHDLYRDDEAKHEIEEFFEGHCFRKSECEFHPELMEPRDFHELFSDQCMARTLKDHDGVAKMSDHFIFVVGCIGDSVDLGGTTIGKLQLLEFVVMFDIASVIILLYCFNKISVFNQEFLDIFDDSRVTMQDFALQCNNVLMDKQTQDSRLVKMKVWLHFNKIIQKACKANDSLFDSKVVDVTLSITTQPKLQLIFKMEIAQSRINEIKTNMKMDVYQDDEYFERR